MVDSDSTLSQEIFDIPEAQRETVIQPHGIVKLTIPRRSYPESAWHFSSSADTTHRLPVRESPLSKETMMDRFEVMTGNSEQVVNRAVDRQKSLNM